MNTPALTPPSPNLELLRELVQEYQPNPRRVPFHNLEPLRDSIATLRAKGASYAVIAELLQRHGIKTSRARVAEYGRLRLEARKKPRRSQRTNDTLPVEPPPQSPVNPLPAPTDNIAPPMPAHQTGRGPHIARIRFADGTASGGDLTEPK